MPLADWNIFKGNAGGAVGNFDHQLNITTPLLGTGSLQASSTAAIPNQPHLSAVPLGAGPLPRGFDSAKLRTLVRLDTLGATTNLVHTGITAMRSQEDLTGEPASTGSAYYYALRFAEDLSSVDTVLHKTATGLDFDSVSGAIQNGTTLGTALLGFSISLGSTVAIELEWRATASIISQLGGALIRCRVGQATDYSDLTEVLNFIDTSALTATVGEGIFISGGASAAVQYSYDETTLFSIS